jgi:hypothetical protein
MHNYWLRLGLGGLDRSLAVPSHPLGVEQHLPLLQGVTWSQDTRTID